mmetsp:Transcript_31172/g.61208  ORF Transcript_31172/g.61208 Transcript_31172/m.61208 type:complete len:80 (-) Transcript_31172:24-263(-)
MGTLPVPESHRCAGERKKCSRQLQSDRPRHKVEEERKAGPSTHAGGCKCHRVPQLRPFTSEVAVYSAINAIGQGSEWLG